MDRRLFAGSVLSAAVGLALGMQGLAAQVWRNYRDPVLAEEILRYLYLYAEAMVGAVVADALYPISENAQIPESYVAQFVQERFGPRA